MQMPGIVRKTRLPVLLLSGSVALGMSACSDAPVVGPDPYQAEPDAYVGLDGNGDWTDATTLDAKLNQDVADLYAYNNAQYGTYSGGYLDLSGEATYKFVSDANVYLTNIFNPGFEAALPLILSQLDQYKAFIMAGVTAPKQQISACAAGKVVAYTNELIQLFTDVAADPSTYRNFPAQPFTYCPIVESFVLSGPTQTNAGGPTVELTAQPLDADGVWVRVLDGQAARPVKLVWEIVGCATGTVSHPVAECGSIVPGGSGLLAGTHLAPGLFTPGARQGATATIRVSEHEVSGGPTAEWDIELLQPAFDVIEVVPGELNMVVGGAVQLVATPWADGVAYPTLSAQIVWDATGTGFTVSPAGLVNATATGTGTITAALPNSTVTAQISVSVFDPAAVAAITVAPEPAEVRVGETLQLTATVTNGAGAILPLIVTWNSADPALVSVSPSGLLTGVTEGAVQVTATAGGVEKVVLVTVLPACEFPGQGKGVKDAVKDRFCGIHPDGPGKSAGKGKNGG